MKFKLAMLAAISALAIASPAAATVYLVGPPNFIVMPQGGTIFTAPSIVANLSVVPNGPGVFTADFRFTIPQFGLGSGDVTTSYNKINGINYITFIPTAAHPGLGVTFNGNVVPVVLSNHGLTQTASLSNVTILRNMQNDLILTFYAKRYGTIGGTLTFDTSVPEPATWATFLLGFGFIGFALRRKLAGKLLAA